MAERGPSARRGPSDASGFTLVEMLAALLILAFGITTVFGAFSSGIATEQNAELIRDAARLATTVREKLLHEGTLGHEGEALPATITDARLPGFPGLKYDVSFEGAGPDGRSELIVKIAVRWLRRGADISEVYRFPLPRGKPLHVRIRDQFERGR